MYYLLLAASVAVSVTKNIITKTDKRCFSGRKNQLFVNIVTGIIALVVFGIFVRDIGIVRDAKFLVLSLFYGIFTMTGQMFYISALETGPVSVCTMIYSCGFIIPTVFAAVYYHEAMSIPCIIGIILILVSIVLVTGKIERAKDGRWIFFAVGSMVSSGLIGVIQKLFRAGFDGGVNEYLFVSFAVMLVFSSVMYPFAGGKDTAVCEGEEKPKPKIQRRLFLSSVFGLGIVLANKFNLYLSGVLPGIVFFPAINGGVLAFTALASSIILREKLTALQWIGIALGIVSIVLVAL